MDGAVETSGNGKDWKEAFKTIKEGIYAASDGDFVIVSQQKYFETVHFRGKNITLQSKDPGNLGVVKDTIIDGDQAGSVVTFSGTENGTCVLSGFTIRNGKATYGGGICGGTEGNATLARIEYNIITDNSADFGGGMTCCDGTIQYNVIEKNIASEDGGGLYECNGGKVGNTISDNVSNRDGGGLYSCGGTIRSNTISGNSADRNGGGLCDCDVLIIDNTIVGNSSGERGGGLYGCDGTIRDNEVSGNSVVESIGTGGGLADCDGDIISNDILGNSAVLGGGGLHGCDGSIQSNSISGNWCTERDSAGGGLYECEATINHNTISDNSADFGGGLYSCHGLIYSNTISLNSAAEDGGGASDCNGMILRNYIIENTAASGGGISHSSGTIERNVILGNSATTFGGGLRALYSYSIVRSNLIAGNSAGQRGGGLDFCRGAILNNTIVDNSEALFGGGLTQCPGPIQNCIIWGNKGCIDCDEQLYECGEPSYCCIENWVGGGEANTASHPVFRDIDGPDDDRQTYDDNDYRLAGESPCVDAGRNEAGAAMWDAFDAEGNPRILPGLSEWTVDMGAYEYVSPSPKPLMIIKPTAYRIRVMWLNLPDATYVLWSSLDLLSGTWTEELTTPSQGVVTTFEEADPPDRQKFYKVETQ